MTSNDLKPQQASQLRQILARQLRFLNKLVDRMNALGFPPDDPLMRDAAAARNAVQDLHVRTHYLGVKQGVGRR